MNYIKSLQADKRSAQAAIAILNTNSDIMIAYLMSAKFTGEANGERKDWVSTGEVVRWIQDTRAAVLLEAQR